MRVVPTAAFYDSGSVDGTVAWNLLGHSAYRGIWFDIGTSLTNARECGPKFCLLSTPPIRRTLLARSIMKSLHNLH